MADETSQPQKGTLHYSWEINALMPARTMAEIISEFAFAPMGRPQSEKTAAWLGCYILRAPHDLSAYRPFMLDSNRFADSRA